jgi:hypothetical protein
VVACVRGPRDDRARRTRGDIGIARGNCRSRRRRGRRARQGVGEICAGGHTSWRVGAGGIAPYLREVRRVLLHSYRQRAVRSS